MRTDLINCFCTQDKNSGNPAAVVSGATMNQSEKQHLAKKLNTPVTVFLSESQNDHFHLEFFYPDTEMPLCLHGTIAAAFVLFKNTTSKNLTCITKNKAELLARQEKDIIQIRVSTSQTPTIHPDKIKIVEMLNLNSIDEIENTLPLTVSSVGSPKLLVPLVSFASLAALKPDFNLIAQWSCDHKINGLYVYTKDTQHNFFDFYARGFNPKTGHNEDAATGVAAGALALSLQKSISVGQGIFMKQPSEIRVSYHDPENIWIGGRTHTMPSPIIDLLHQGNIIAYPTEAVYGLGCDPLNESAVLHLLDLKKRDVNKGLILIAASVAQIMPYIDTTQISPDRMQQILASWPGPFTWAFPATEKVPRWIRGGHSTVAVRVTAHPVANALCAEFGRPLVSTSANVANQLPAKNKLEVQNIFSEKVVFIVEGNLGDSEKPTEIRDAKSGALIRE